ncbi:MAG: hypothetical protein M1818_004819 [Claussenomyces sp. TS43310]|nr:MAG: hypothetical protein M1818_004819 [Claussenomyces sp. TS43310]
MSDFNAYNRGKHEECIAHVVWAAHILHDLAGERSQTRLLPELDPEEDFDGDELDAKTESEVILASSGDLIRSKLLDCVAELVSPSKGWDHVVTTGLRESADSIEIDITRNDGFSMTGGSKRKKSRRKGVDTQYFEHLQNYLASASGESVSALSLKWFDSVAIEFNRERVDNWAAIARKYVALLPSLQDHVEDSSPDSQNAAKTWTNLTTLLSHKGGGESILREQIVYAAYECIVSNEVRAVLRTTFNIQMASKLWKILRSIARPVSNCRLLIRIVGCLPQFRRVKICPHPPGPNTKLGLKYLVDVRDAWVQLHPFSSSGADLPTSASLQDRFRRDCARTFSSHAEVQLYLYYEHNVSLTPSVDYFGCSKKSCLLCEAFLQALPQPISTRGRHGICYPAWVVPYTGSEDIMVALQQLEKTLVSRIEMHMTGQLGSAFLDQVPQSTVASDLPSSSMEEILKRKEMMKSAEEKRQMLQRQRSIV